MDATLEAVEREYFSKKLIECGVPEHRHDGILRYLVDRIEDGGCMTAVFANDLMEAFGRADVNTAAGMKNIVTFIYSYAPNASHGSYEQVEKWLKREV